jgi:Animal haem peroxidase
VSTLNRLSFPETIVNLANLFIFQLHNRLQQNQNGFGLDLFSMDIQRGSRKIKFYRDLILKLSYLGRDHGLGTWLDTRRKCGFQANFKTFDEMVAILPKSSVDLLKATYASVEDIDLIVGGALETLRGMKKVFTGETFGCIVGEQYRKTMGGDSYFFSHKTNPYPFTDAQLDVINSMKFNNLICENTNIESINALWYILERPANPKLPCSSFKQMDLTAWKNI